MYIRLSDGAYPVDPRRAHPRVSFPRGWLGGEVEGVTYAFVHPIDVPQATGTQSPVKGAPTLDGDRWVETWALVEDEPETVAAKAEAKWADIRTERNGRLAECDWTQLADAPLTTEQRAEWKTYRQALRDLTRSPDPFGIKWPEAP